MRYYVVQVRTGKEIETGRIIERYFASLAKYKISVLAGQERDTRNMKRLAGQSREKQKPLLPGYVVIGCEQLSNDIYYHIRKVQGVFRVLRDCLLPAEYEKLLARQKNRMAENFDQLRRLARKKELLKKAFQEMLERFKRNLISKETAGWGYFAGQGSSRKDQRLHPLLN